MMNSVRWLDEAFHTVRLERGSTALGRMNGNIDRPTVEMMPRVAAVDPVNDSAALSSLNPTRAMAAPTKPSTGAISIQLWRP